ncbi:hypothetical protein VLK81_01980 [Citroniella saccharovorans]|uniref:ABC-2 family transporter protein n=1 Tax=Citroniella saccharovorans TaxID=2053367 RepID=A0AAW9MRQ0_9FIRM|nr:hypothetical protein [Citroniella saccharovorans]MEB3428801.1 hypothetical protein [Citroniella saccharovorans]
MISYIKSELFRAKKTKAFRYLILAVAIFVPLIITLSATNTKFDIDYYSGAGELAIGFGTIVVSCIALFFIFKNKDTKTQIIGYGIKKEKLYWWDFITYNLIVAILALIIMLVLIVLSFPLGAIFKAVHTDTGMYAFIKTVLVSLLLQINVNSVLYGLAYLFNKPFGGILMNYAAFDLILRVLFIISGEKYSMLILKIGDYLPTHILNQVANRVLYEEPIFSKAIAASGYKIGNIILSFVICFAISHFLGLLAFKKRELL